MNRAGLPHSPGLLHLTGTLSLLGWAAMAVASHRLERPLAVFLGLMAGQWLVFLLAWRASRRLEPGPVLTVVFGWSMVFLACGQLAVPLMEDDHYRFLWDGRQLMRTGNPYATTPAAHFGHEEVSPRFEEILDHINYPHVPTIYGPVCQYAFGLSHVLAPGQLWPWKLLVALAQAGLLVAVISLARRPRGGRAGGLTPGVVQAALVIGWCPLLVFETGFNAHPDVLAVALLAAALGARGRGALAWCGVLCGLAVGAKVIALLLVPFLLMRSVRGWAGLIAGLGAAYAPFWVQGSTADVGALITFAREWEFNSSIYGVVRWLGGRETARAVCGVTFAALWGWLWLRWRAQLALTPGVHPPGLAVFGGFLLLSAVVNPWYLIWLAPFVALRPTATGLAALALVSLSYITGLNLGAAGLDNFEHPGWLRWIEYGGLIAVAAIEARRWKRSR